MFKIMIGEWKELKSTHAAEMLKGEFPKCGVKYTSKHGAGLVLVRDGIPRNLLIEKAKAAGAKDNVAYVFKVPQKISAIYGHIPTLVAI